jgi:predicted nucleic-acid-binding Zn-ribbon protein
MTTERNDGGPWPTYAVNRKCPKCGCHEARTVFKPAGEGSFSEDWDTRMSDRMVRTCPRCHFYWYERPLDSVSVSGLADFMLSERQKGGA